MKAEFARRRLLIVDELRKVPGFRCHMPMGAFYVFPNVTEACRIAGCKDSKELVDRLLFEAGVSVLPRTAFGVKNAIETEEYIRLSYATSKENIIKGIGRIRDFMEKQK
jgi:aspartate aminotransferase